MPSIEKDPLDISIPPATPTEAETIVIDGDEDPSSPEIVSDHLSDDEVPIEKLFPTEDSDSGGEKESESLLISSSPEVSHDDPDIISYDYNCDICFDIFCTKEELDIHMKLHAQIKIPANTKNRRKNNYKSVSSHISGKASSLQEESMTKIGTASSPHHSRAGTESIRNFVSNFTESTAKEKTSSPRVQGNVTNNLFSGVLSNGSVQQQQMPLDNTPSSQGQLYFIGAPAINTNQKIVSDEYGNLYVILGDAVSPGNISNTSISAKPPPIQTNPLLYTPTIGRSVLPPNGLENPTSLTSNDLTFVPSGQTEHHPVTDQPTISLARLNQNIERMMVEPSGALKQSAFQKSFSDKVGLNVTQPQRTRIEKISDPTTYQHPIQSRKQYGRKINILRKKNNSNKIALTETIPRLQMLNTGPDFNDSTSLNAVPKQNVPSNHLKNTLLGVSSSFSQNGSNVPRKSPGDPNQIRNEMHSNNPAYREKVITTKIASEFEVPPLTFRRPKLSKPEDPLSDSVKKAPTVDRILMPKITNVMSMDSDVMESDGITILCDDEREVDADKMITGIGTKIEDDDDDIERSLPISLIMRPDADEK